MAGRLGITVNVASPGPIQTGYITADNMDNTAEQTPLGRVGEPEDVAVVIFFLCSRPACTAGDALRVALNEGLRSIG
ncbi:MAG: SDR family oxidoreductase [Nocardioides sp.]